MQMLGSNAQPKGVANPAATRGLNCEDRIQNAKIYARTNSLLRSSLSTYYSTVGCVPVREIGNRHLIQSALIEQHPT